MSAEALKQLKIKTAMLKRLRKEYESYEKETKKFQQKIEQLEIQFTANPNDEQTEVALKKNVSVVLVRKSF